MYPKTTGFRFASISPSDIAVWFRGWKKEIHESDDREQRIRRVYAGITLRDARCFNYRLLPVIVPFSSGESGRTGKPDRIRSRERSKGGPEGIKFLESVARSGYNGGLERWTFQRLALPLGDRAAPSEILRVAFTSRGRQISFRKGEVLIRKGESASGVYLILEGYVDVVSDSEPDMILISLAEGDIIGELAALTKKPRSASVLARTDGRAVCVDTTEFTLLLADPRFVRALLKVLAHKLILTTLRVEVLELRRATARIGKALLLFHHHPELIHPPVTQRFLEHFCRVAERQVRRIIGRFEKEGLIEYSGKPREVHAKNPEGLRRIVEGGT